MFDVEWIVAIATYTLLCALACRAVIPGLVRLKVFDNANERSSHKGNVPTGGGLAFVPLLLLAIIAAGYFKGAGYHWWIAIAVFAAYAGLSFLDDLYDLGALTRLLTHLFLASILVFSLPEKQTPHLALLPDFVLKVCTVFAYVWWVNLYNFMDGIDGLTGMETIAICLGLLLLSVLKNSEMGQATAALTLATSMAFLTVNWQPARVFMGDVGSITLAAITGYMLMLAAGIGAWAAVILLPLYYLVDATSTLFWRLAKFEKVWLAHRQHAYQIYVAKGYSHARACLWIATLNVFLIFLTLLEFFPLWQRFTVGMIAVCALITYFRRAKR